MTVNTKLRSLENQILAILIIYGELYGVPLLEHVRRLTSFGPSVASLYHALDRLEALGLVASRWGEATPERRGNRKRYYKITDAGRSAFNS